MDKSSCIEGVANVVYDKIFLSMQILQIIVDVITIVIIGYSRNYITRRLINKDAIVSLLQFPIEISSVPSRCYSTCFLSPCRRFCCDTGENKAIKISVIDSSHYLWLFYCQDKLWFDHSKFQMYVCQNWNSMLYDIFVTHVHSSMLWTNDGNFFYG